MPNFEDVWWQIFETPISAKMNPIEDVHKTQCRDESYRFPQQNATTARFVGFFKDDRCVHQLRPVDDLQ